MFCRGISSVFVKEPLGPLPECCYMARNISDHIHTSDKDVYKHLKYLDIYKNFGTDNIHPKLLNSLADNPNFIYSLKICF